MLRSGWTPERGGKPIRRQREVYGARPTVWLSRSGGVIVRVSGHWAISGMEDKIQSLEALADELTSQLSASINGGITYDMKPELAAVHEGVNTLRDLAAVYRALSDMYEGNAPRELRVTFSDSEIERWAQ